VLFYAGIQIQIPFFRQNLTVLLQLTTTQALRCKLLKSARFALFYKAILAYIGWSIIVRYAVLGDVHGNLPALEAVLEDIDSFGVDTILCVGDVVGYGANPGDCLHLCRERFHCSVGGNHDCGATGRMDLTYFNADARDAITWTDEQLSERDRDYLGDLPLTAQYDGVSLVHSSPHFPENYSYIQTLYDAELAFSKLEQDVGFIGHSHVPIIFINSDPVDYFLVSHFNLPRNRQVIVNVGSVGQPRDLDSRACYVIMDTDEGKVHIRRVEYDIDAAADNIRAAGLPETNAQRLYWGR
jgi:diadenosine tetraphosphatase ApaH/serine/threonine PP2A family protein phosphatase